MNKIKNDLKIYLTILLILTTVVILGSAYIYHITKTDLPEIDKLKDIAIKQVSEFTKNSSNNTDCINETLIHLKSCEIGDFKCRVINKIFLQQCLINTKKSLNICSEILSQPKNENVKTSRWVTSTCRNHKEIHNVVCSNTLDAVEEFCSLSEKRR
ncbi:MAG: hypothetical protein OEV78_01555 [Spirochaetia bacterium]|nr:hypothetical protein [Spirochaetia bacterium]